MAPKFTDIQGAKEQLCCSRSQIYKFIDAGELARVKLGAKTLITVESIERLATKLVEQAA